MNFKLRSGFTLIEMLIVIAIVTILSVVVVLTLNPPQMLMQARDSTRISDITTLNNALGLYSSVPGSGSIGSSNVVYVSLSDPTATTTAGDQCQGLGLITLPSPYIYHCSASSTLRNIDSTGWVPVNFSSAPGALFSQLPVDPVNNSSTRLYYSYVTNGNQFEFTSPIESQTYQVGGSKDIISNDGGALATVFQKGSQNNLEPLDYGDTALMGYWPLNEGTGTAAYDYSGNIANAQASWGGSQVGTNGYYSAGKGGFYPWAGTIDGSSTFAANYSNTTNPYIVTVSAWIYMKSIPTTTGRIAGFTNGNAGPIDDRELYVDGNGYVRFYVWSGSARLITSTSSSALIPLNQWVNVVGTSNGSSIVSYVNGIQVGSVSGSEGGSPTSNIVIGGSSGNYKYINGLINDVRIYARALSAAQVAALYQGGK